MWCLDRKIHLTAAYVPGACNQEADELSRNFNEDTEWSLCLNTFNKILQKFPDMTVDLFASNSNHKLQKYVSYTPDTQALAVDAFSLHLSNDLFYVFPPSSLVARILQKIEEDGTEAVLVCPVWTTQCWLAALLCLISGLCSSKNIVITTQTGKATPIKENEPRGSQNIRRALRGQGVLQAAINIIMRSWRQSTKKQYNSYIQKWFSFFGNKINPFQPTVNHILAFFVVLFKQGLKYSVFQTARAAINNLTSICGDRDFSSHPLLKRFLSGVFTLRPSLPKYQNIWDTNIILTYLGKIKEPTLLQLSRKLSMLFLLLTAQRCQTLHLVELDDIEITNDMLIIHPNHLLKHSKPGHHLESIKLLKYPSNPHQCIVTVLKEYLASTKHLRGTEQKLLIGSQKPHKAVSKQTVSRWVKHILIKAGVGQGYGTHSTRAASVSAAKFGGIPLGTIIKTAGWKNVQTFAKFYNKEIVDTRTLQTA